MIAQPVELASVARAAEHYGVHPRTIRKLIETGDIQPYRIGPKVLRIDLNKTDALFRGDCTPEN
ncbi:helix-turn-helix domain-containing protein [Arthrobacter sp. E3]|uniref:helix-turn-helix domain-containing protein n=1 Tax=Arthrobacter sp. E3 TaxID=517402 RepID=UPI001A945214|nr:helix-turn-helix domain-containing protein [Arthrobacter sp. E3]